MEQAEFATRRRRPASELASESRRRWFVVLEPHLTMSDSTTQASEPQAGLAPEPAPAPPSEPFLPTKRIISRAHLQLFLDSPTHASLVSFLEELNESVVSTKLSDSIPESRVRLFPPPTPS